MRYKEITEVKNETKNIMWLIHDVEQIQSMISQRHLVSLACERLCISKSTYYRYKEEPRRIPLDTLLSLFVIYDNLVNDDEITEIII